MPYVQGLRLHEAHHPTPPPSAATLPLQGRVKDNASACDRRYRSERHHPAPPASVASQAAPQAFASSRTRRM
jgi:hypothetical protein